MGLTDLLVSVPGIVCINPDEITLLKPADMRRQRSGTQAGSICEIIHVHLAVLYQKTENLQTDLGAERAEHIKLFFHVLDVTHITDPFLEVWLIMSAYLSGFFPARQYRSIIFLIREEEFWIYIK